MELVLLGAFETSGSIVATDPCYELKTWCNKHLKVKPGEYQAYVVYGQKPDYSGWDSVEGNFRVAQLAIIHSAYRGPLSFSKEKATIGIDSGQAGFFNVQHYKKDSSKPFEKTGEPYSFIRDEITSMTIKNNRDIKSLKDGKLDANFLKMLDKVFKNDEFEAREFLKLSIESHQDDIKEFKNILKTNKYPAFLEVKHTNNFYEIMCDLTDGVHNSGVLSPYGVVSRSGMGDGSANLFSAKNPQGEIIASYLEFMNLDDIT